MFLEYSYLIPVFPLIGFVVITFIGKKLSEGGGYLAVILSGMSLILSLGVIYEILKLEKPFEMIIYEWLPGIEFGILIDKVSAVMLFVISFIGFLIMVYSLGYMHKDESKPRYYAEMSLFISSMLVIAIANNLLLLFIGWELVGLCSYLLIGFWYRKPSASSAAKKAIVVTRFADIFFALGLVLTYNTFGTLNILEIFEKLNVVYSYNPGIISLIALLLFIGAIGKSSQFPLHVWLPDAMEGPTTVSALIHAATMVKAGIFLVARMYPLYLLSGDVMYIIALFGAITAFIAASMGLVMTDIKRIIAYSTMSHLGLMMLALGVGSIAAGLYHLLNHSFAKALLFLSAGAVLHATHEQLDIRKHGGLRKVMPITGTVALIGAWALSGLPPLSGYWSKDEIIILSSVSPELLGLAFGVTLLSAAYLFRWYYIIFTGKPGETYNIAHEAPKVMTIPLIILAIGACISWLVIYFGFKDSVSEWVNEYVEYETMVSNLEEVVEKNHVKISLIAGVLAFISFLITTLIYVKKRIKPETFREKLKPLHVLFVNKYYFDHIYNYLAENVIYRTISFLIDKLEKLYDGFIDLLGKIVYIIGRISRKIQTGNVQDYITAIILGIILLIIITMLGGV